MTHRLRNHCCGGVQQCSPRLLSYRSLGYIPIAYRSLGDVSIEAVAAAVNIRSIDRKENPTGAGSMDRSQRTETERQQKTLHGAWLLCMRCSQERPGNATGLANGNLFIGDWAIDCFVH